MVANSCQYIFMDVKKKMLNEFVKNENECRFIKNECILTVMKLIYICVIGSIFSGDEHQKA